MATAASAVEKESRVREVFSELYGDEETLIIVNTTPGVVPIGFKEGDGRGEEIPRSHLPIVLNGKAPREVWLRSNDFRQAVTKGWLKVITKQEYDTTMASEGQKQRELKRLAAMDGPVATSTRVDAVREQIPSGEEGPQEELDIDPNTASLVPAGTGSATGITTEQMRRGLEQYDRGADAPPLPSVLKDGRAAKAEYLCERIKTKQISPIDAIQEVNNDAALFTNEDLQYIINQAAYSGVKALAQRIIDARTKGE